MRFCVRLAEVAAPALRLHFVEFRAPTDGPRKQRHPEFMPPYSFHECSALRASKGESARRPSPNRARANLAARVSRREP